MFEKKYCDEYRSKTDSNYIYKYNDFIKKDSLNYLAITTFHINHEKYNLDEKYWIIIYQNNLVIYSGPYQKSIRTGRFVLNEECSLSISIIDQITGFNYVWSNDSGGYIKSNKIYIKLFYDLDLFSEYEIDFE